MATYCTIYLVRHGETDWNVNHKVQGHTDIPLNIKGEQQAQKLAKTFKDISFDVAFSSDLSRAQKTAEFALLEKQLAVQTTALMRERFFGSLEGANTDVFFELEKLKENLSKEQKLIHKHVPEMESEQEVITRVIRFLREIAVAYSGKTVLVVSHGAVMRILLTHVGFVEHIEDISKIENTAYIKLRSDGVDFFVDDTIGIEKV